MTVEVQWPTGRSHRLTIQPRRPDALGQVSVAKPLAETQPRDVSDVTGASAGAGGSNEAQALLRSLTARTGAMAQDVQRLRALAARLDAALARQESAGETASDDQVDQLSQLQLGVDRQTLSGQTLGRLLDQFPDASAAQRDPELAALVQRLRQDLRALRLARGAAGMIGPGPAGADSREMASWLKQLIQAAEHDAILLDADAAALAEASSGHAGAAAGVTDHLGGSAAIGTGNTAETGNAGERVDTGSALATQAPVSYRDLVGRYYNRLAADAAAPKKGTLRP
jgi:hypothetical protein